MPVSVIVATLGRTERLRETLASLSACEPPPDEVIVVDGDGSEATRRVVESFATSGTRSSHRYLPSSRGLTHQRNVGLAAATHEIVVFVDDDMSFRLTPEAFQHVEQGFEDPAVAGVTGHIVDDEQRRVGRSRSRVRRLLFGKRNEGKLTRFGYPRYLLDPLEEADVEYMRGGFMSARRDPARTTGFDETLTGYALAEDEDFSYRLSRLGRIRYLPEIVVEHERFGPRNMRALNRSLVVNRVYLFRKNFRRTPLARLEFAAFVGVLVCHRLLNGEWAGVRGLAEGIGDVLRGRVPEPSAPGIPGRPATDSPITPSPR